LRERLLQHVVGGFRASCPSGKAKQGTAVPSDEHFERLLDAVAAERGELFIGLRLQAAIENPRAHALRLSTAAPRTSRKPWGFWTRVGEVRRTGLSRSTSQWCS
jgi:hypothetical protein